MSSTSRSAKAPRQRHRRAPTPLCFAVAAAILAFACGGGSSSPALSNTGTSAARAAVCVGEAPSYQSEVAPLLEHYCFSCHSGAGEAAEDHDFSKYTVLHAQRRALNAELEAGAMPPPGHAQPSRTERALLARWACSGAPEN